MTPIGWCDSTAAIPVIILYMLAQRALVQGRFAGSVRGQGGRASFFLGRRPNSSICTIEIPQNIHRTYCFFSKISWYDG